MEKYLIRFPGEMPERRRYALVMLSAIDDGVGKVKEALRKYNIEENTIIFFIGDNGAPLKITKEDKPIPQVIGCWDGSLNDPYVGEIRKKMNTKSLSVDHFVQTIGQNVYCQRLVSSVILKLNPCNHA